jgi:hypothetical protein
MQRESGTLRLSRKLFDLIFAEGVAEEEASEY